MARWKAENETSSIDTGVGSLGRRVNTDFKSEGGGIIFLDLLR